MKMNSTPLHVARLVLLISILRLSAGLDGRTFGSSSTILRHSLTMPTACVKGPDSSIRMPDDKSSPRLPKRQTARCDDLERNPTISFH
jgi:hypothetical protein